MFKTSNPLVKSLRSRKLREDDSFLSPLVQPRSRPQRRPHGGAVPPPKKGPLPCQLRPSKTPSLMKPTTAPTSSWPQECFPMERFTKLSARKSSNAAEHLQLRAKPSPSLSPQVSERGPLPEVQTAPRPQHRLLAPGPAHPSPLRRNFK